MPFVRRIAAALRAAGHSPWLAEDEILVGESIPAAIDRGLNDADFIVLCLSKAAAECGWVGAQRDSTLMRQIGERRELVLPVRLDETPQPHLGTSLKWADLFPDEQAFTEGIAQLTRSIDGHAERTKGSTGRVQCPAPATATPGSFWPTAPPPINWSLCDHLAVRNHFAELITAKCSYKALLLRGPSGRGKTSVTEQMLGNVRRLPGVLCGRLDLKGGVRLQGALEQFALDLRLPVPSAGRVTEGLATLLRTLLGRTQPTVVIFDTYEAAGEEVQEWISKSLLASLIPPEIAHLRIVIAGQTSPKRHLASWGPDAVGPIELTAPTEDDWYAYAQRNRLKVTRDFVAQLYNVCGERSPLLAEVLGPIHDG